jgi:hypothetical protein
MAVLAIVGLVPLWFAAEHMVKTSSKPMQEYLVKERGLVSGKPWAQRFLDSLSSALQHQHGITATCKYSENVGCKAFRLACMEETDKRFSILCFATSVSCKLLMVMFTSTILVLDQARFGVLSSIDGLWVEGFGYCLSFFSNLNQ